MHEVNAGVRGIASFSFFGSSPAFAQGAGSWASGGDLLAVLVALIAVPVGLLAGLGCTARLLSCSHRKLTFVPLLAGLIAIPLSGGSANDFLSMAYPFLAAYIPTVIIACVAAQFLERSKQGPL
ncbi:hypothetical protein AACH06_29680 [Ideonella sp. DXS29W]|uniref:Uncharacterized protein n=1 Tax=Ideonella lacteola TaxID=2984193 RepID=A0ABU9BYD7_9BURK